MAEKKTLDDLAKQVIDSQQGLMSVEDLKTFFEDTPQAAAPINQVPAEPVIAPTPQAPAVTPTPPVEPAVGQPNVQEFVPEKFRDADLATSVQKLSKSYSEVEAELIKERGERANLERMVQSLSTQPPMPEPIQPQAPPPAITGDDEVEDSEFFEKPKEATTKVSKRVAAEVAAAMLIAYHNALTEASRRTQYVDNFRATHPDFNEYREDMTNILRARPDLDKKAESLPVVYEMARISHKARLDRMRQELGVQAPVAPAPAKPQINEAELIEKAKLAILSDIQKRRAASGISGGATPVSPAARAAPVVTQTPLTPEDELFKEIMDSGPKKLDLNL
jgi:hypothetical protein